MIELGYLSLTNSDEAIETRKRIRQLADSFRFGEIQAARLESISYQICRFGCRNGRKMHIEVGVDPVNSRMAMILNFLSYESIESIAGIPLFFDTVAVKKMEGDITSLYTVKFLPEWSQRNFFELIEDQRKFLSTLSKNELLTILAEKNDELEASFLELGKLSQAVTHNPVSIVITDNTGRIEYVNPKFSVITGYSAEEVLGQNPRVLKSGIHPAEFYSALWKTILSGEQWYGEICNRQKCGSLFWETISISPVKNDEGQIKSFVAVKQDITERKEMEKELQSRIEELNRSRRATLNILEDLDEARKLAEESTKTKSDFLANMSHEIRTPMNAIIGMSHLALQTDLNPKQRNYIEKVHRSGGNLLGIINDILDFSKIEAGKMTMENADFRLEDVMEYLENTVGMKVEEKELELRIEIAPDVPAALIGDSLRLGQILLNLGSNAVKFTEKGEIVFGVEPVSRTEDTIMLHFWAKDSGIGMTPEQCGKMFQSFSQADTSTTRKYGGTGLGLSISKKMVELMDGRIWVESEAGKGSTFHFHARFGLQKGADEVFRKDGTAESRSQDKSDNMAEAVERLAGCRVLLVEDNAMNQELAMELLENAGMTVALANNGQEALDILAGDTAFNGILMDCQMPVMDGYTATREIRKNPLFKDTPIIAMTANAMAGDKEKVVEAGMNDHIAKPLDVGQMFATLAKWILPENGAALSATAESDPVSSAAAELDMDKVQPLLDRLAIQLAEMDTEASDTVEELRTLTKGTSLAGGVKKVARAVADYEFDVAEEALKELIELNFKF